MTNATQYTTDLEGTDVRLGKGPMGMWMEAHVELADDDAAGTLTVATSDYGEHDGRNVVSDELYEALAAYVDGDTGEGEITDALTLTYDRVENEWALAE